MFNIARNINFKELPEKVQNEIKNYILKYLNDKNMRTDYKIDNCTHLRENEIMIDISIVNVKLGFNFIFKNNEIVEVNEYKIGSKITGRKGIN